MKAPSMFSNLQISERITPEHWLFQSAHPPPGPISDPVPSWRARPPLFLLSLHEVFWSVEVRVCSSAPQEQVEQLNISVAYTPSPSTLLFQPCLWSPERRNTTEIKAWKDARHPACPLRSPCWRSHIFQGKLSQKLLAAVSSRPGCAAS